MVDQGALRFEQTQLMGNKQPRTVGLFNGRGSHQLCPGHNEIREQRQGNLIGVSEGIQQIAEAAGLVKGKAKPVQVGLLDYPD